MDCIVHGVAKSRTRLSDFDFTHSLATSYAVLMYNTARCNTVLFL